MMAFSRLVAGSLLLDQSQSSSATLGGAEGGSPGSVPVELPARLRQAEVRVCRSVVANVFGYHALQVSSLTTADDLLATAQTISCHQLRVNPAGKLEGCVAGQLAELPFQDDSVAMVVLDHVHEQMPGRRELWGELHRVLRPGGIAIVLGLNPRGHRHPLLIHPLSPPAMAEQLRGFDFQTLLVRPVSDRGGRLRDWLARTSRRWSGAPWLGWFGQSFVLVARKNSSDPQIVPLRPGRLSALKSAAPQLGGAQGRGRFLRR